MCTIAFVTWLLNYMPPPGSVITVPREYASQYGEGTQAKAKRCAARYKITLEIAK